MFLEVILPVLSIAALGGWLADRLEVPVKPISQLTFYFFSPALVFASLSDIELSGSATARLILAAIVSFAAMVAVSSLVSVGLRHDARTRAAMAMIAAMINGGNMGLPVALLAFGEPGLEAAIVLFVVSVLLANTAGIVLASMAGGQGIGRAWMAPVAVPSVWAAICGLAVNAAELDLPDAARSAIDTVAGASIPVMLVVLGMHVLRPVKVEVPIDLAAAVILRLGVGPLVAWAATEALAVEGVAQKAAVVLAGMPTAVVTTIYATQYDARPSFVTRAVITSTVASIATLTVLVSIVR